MLRNQEQFTPFVMTKGSGPLALDDEGGEWGDVEEEDLSPLDSESEDVAPDQDDEFDNLVARYFSDVRRYALLSRIEEQELWKRIERVHMQVRRALYLSPSALPTLTRLWHQIELEEIPLEQVVQEAGVTAAEQAEDAKQSARQAGDRVRAAMAFPNRLRRPAPRRRGRAR